MKSLKILICLATISTAIFQSCIKEKDCPVEPVLYVGIQDKNYDNVADIPLAMAIDEELPFKNYVNTLNIEYLYANSSMQNPIKRLVSLTDDAKLYTLPAEQLMEGRHELTIIGNQPILSITPNVYPIELHPNNAEYTDIYIGRDTIKFPIISSKTIMLSRTKGKLIILCSGFPENVARVDIRVTNLYNGLNNNMTYTGNAQITKSFILPSPVQDVSQFDVLLAPTVENVGSETFFTLYDENGDVISIFSNININIKRNQVSVINVLYNPDTEEWEIYITADGVWVRVHNIDIQ